MSALATPPNVTSLLRSRQEVADGTMAFRFDKPPGWVFKAGQFIDMTLLDPPETDAEGNTRSFSTRLGPATLHPLTLLYAVNGSAMISATLRIPKP